MNYIHPYFLINGEEPAPNFRRGNYIASPTADQQYKQGDIVELDGSAQVIRAIVGGAAFGPVAIAGQDWSQPAAYLPPAAVGETGTGGDHWFLNRGVPMNIVEPNDHIAVFTFRHSAADGADYTFLAADLVSVQAQEQRELAYDTVEDVLVITNGTTNVNVQMLYVADGAVGDTNVRVACRILSSFLLA